MTYTLQGKDRSIELFVLDILPHKEYERLFGY